MFFLGLNTCSDPRSPWARASAESSVVIPNGAAAAVHFVDRELLPDPRWTVDAQRRANPVYRMLEGRPGASLDLERLRLIAPADRFVLVDTASQRLWMIDRGRIAGAMKVIVGKAGMETPMMAALIRYAAVNPYWNIPPDLVRQRVVQHVLPQGPAWLRQARLQAVASYDRPDAPPLDPSTINWRAVADGRADVGLRQLPGPANMMGAVKFMFPNPLGIYLHDTPNKALFNAASRRFSSGCVRLQHANMLYRWLFGATLPPRAERESRVALPAPVPVYILSLPSLASA